MTFYYPRRVPGDYHHFMYPTAQPTDPPDFMGTAAAADLAKGFAGIPGTPCCYQMSYALNKAGLPVGSHSHRRANQRASILGEKWYFLLCVDEMEWFLDQYANPIEVKSSTAGAYNDKDIRSALQGRYGILVCRKGWAGLHTEIWNRSAFWQTDIGDGIFTNAESVKFYDMSTGDN